MRATKQSATTSSSGQLELPFPKTWGGRRDGAGRPPRPARATSTPHTTRPLHKAAHPVHMTLRARRAVGGFLRSELVFPLVLSAIRATNRVDQGNAFRIVHFSVQTNHLHLIVEAQDKSALRRGAAGLAVRAARAINRALGRRGAVWAERYHVLFMCSPRHVRNTIVYVLFNAKKHGLRLPGLDPCSSAPWFEGFRRIGFAREGPWSSGANGALGVSSADNAGEPAIVPARTWLLSVGWRRHGLLAHDETPAH